MEVGVAHEDGDGEDGDFDDEEIITFVRMVRMKRQRNIPLCNAWKTAPLRRSSVVGNYLM